MTTLDGEIVAFGEVNGHELWFPRLQDDGDAGASVQLLIEGFDPLFATHTLLWLDDFDGRFFGVATKPLMVAT